MYGKHIYDVPRKMYRAFLDKIEKPCPVTIFTIDEKNKCCWLYAQKNRTNPCTKKKIVFAKKKNKCKHPLSHLRVLRIARFWHFERLLKKLLWQRI